jgi:hypothetical protein
MTATELVQQGGGELATGGELARNPAAVYLTSLAPGSRRAMINALGTMAATMAGTEASGKQEQLTAALAYPWQDLRFQHTAAAADASRLGLSHAPRRTAIVRGLRKITS